MKKSARERDISAETNSQDDEMLPEYDFSGGARGKYAAVVEKGANLVLLDPDVWAAFPDSASVNRALRLLIELAQRENAEKVLAEKKGPYQVE